MDILEKNLSEEHLLRKRDKTYSIQLSFQQTDE